MRLWRRRTSHRGGIRLMMFDTEGRMLVDVTSDDLHQIARYGAPPDGGPADLFPDLVDPPARIKVQAVMLDALGRITPPL